MSMSCDLFAKEKERVRLDTPKENKIQKKRCFVFVLIFYNKRGKNLFLKKIFCVRKKNLVM